MVPDSNIPSGWYLVEANEVESTNDEIKCIYKSNQSIPLVLLAKKQTHGRGRLKRHWYSLEGNLFFSFLIDFKSLSPESISYLVSVSLLDAIEKYVSHEINELELKWPNDICYKGAKISGILMETICKGEIIIIGIGVNLVKTNIDRPIYPVGDLSAFSIEPKKLMYTFCNEFVSQLYNFKKNGFEGIRKKWLSRAKGIGSEIIVHLANKHYNGIFKGITKEGFLILDQGDSGLKIISTGDILFGSEV